MGCIFFFFTALNVFLKPTEKLLNFLKCRNCGGKGTSLPEHTDPSGDEVTENISADQDPCHARSFDRSYAVSYYACLQLCAGRQIVLRYPAILFRVAELGKLELGTTTVLNFAATASWHPE